MNQFMLSGIGSLGNKTKGKLNMKKLMIAAAVVLAATFANAGCYTWGFATPAAIPGQTIDWDTGDGALTYGTAMLFIGTVGETLNGSNYTLDFSNADYVTTGGFDPNTYGFGEAEFESSRTSDTVSTTAAQGYTLILFDQDGVTDYENYTGDYYIYTGTSVVSQDPATDTKFAMFTTDVAIGGSDWKTAGAGPDPIPEPTSGLLLLLGVAGLALKRKRG